MRLVYSFVCALILLCAPREAVQAQDLSVQVGCSNHPVDILRRGFLRCTYAPALYREEEVTPPDSNALVYTVVPLNSTGRPSRTTPADSTLGVVEVMTRVRRIPRGASSDLRFPFRASVIPDPDSARILTINPWLVDSTDSRPGRPRPDSTYYIRLSGNRNYVRFLHRSHGLLPFVVPLKVRWRTRSLSTIDSVGSTRAAGDISLGAMYSARIAERSYRYERGATEPIAITGFSWTVGIGVGFSVEEVDKSNTLSSPGVFENRSVNMAIISPTVALMTGYGDFLFGVYGGIDLGLTSGAGAWDFNGNRWLGVGLSTELPFNL